MKNFITFVAVKNEFILKTQIIYFQIMSNIKFHFFLLLICNISFASAQKKPKWVDKSSKALISIETTTKEGATKTGNGFFIREDGIAVSSYSLFNKASKATVTTSTGETLMVTEILGADEIYGVVRFKVAVPKKTPFIQNSSTVPAVGEILYILPSSQEPNLSQGKISEITKIKGTYNYYKVDMPLHASQENYPMLNDQGQVLAMTQVDASGKGNTYGISVEYINSLAVTSMDLLKRTYSDIGIRKAWPESFDEAQISLLLYTSQQDSKTYLETVSDFINAFPTRYEGYINRAAHYVYNRSSLASSSNDENKILELAWNDLEKVSQLSQDKSIAFYEKAKLILGATSSDSTLNYGNWTMNSAEQNIQKAIELNNSNPLYHQLKGEIEFIKENYEAAYDEYMYVNNSPLATSLTFYLAAKCKQQTSGYNIMEVINLLDSAATKEKSNETPSYILENVELKMQAGLYEQAIKDYDRYYTLMGGNVNDGFYYFREQAKFRTNDLDGALKDIDKALLIDNNNTVYHAERASILLRKQDPASAQLSAQKAIELDPEFSSAYRILGICLIRQDKKQEACPYLEKAKELGDTLVEKLIKDNCK
jgi:Tfp pilus assembly protein PilF